MIVSFLIVILLATLVFIINHANKSLWWVSGFLYATAFSIMSFYLDQELSHVSNLFINTMNFSADAAIAYTFGMFGIAYSGLWNSRLRRIAAITGLVLVFVVWGVTPLSASRHINYEGGNALAIVLLVTLSLAVGALQLIAASYMEKHPYRRIERFLTNLLIIPAMIWICLCYWFGMFQLDLWQYNYVGVIGFLLLFIIIGLRKGVLGVKIRIEQLQTDASLHVLKNSASLLNHTVKNEIGKIDILLHQVQHSLQASSTARRDSGAGTEEMIALAAQSVDHIQSMIQRIHDHAQAIEVKLQKLQLQPLVEQALEYMERTLGQGVEVRRVFTAVSEVYCDPVHTKEVVLNIVRNAVEAMDGQGILQIRLSETRKQVILLVQDTGKGIATASLSAIFEPFYSTKERRTNYGLGLFYCKHVMLQQHGTIEIASTEGEGTSVCLRFNS